MLLWSLRVALFLACFHNVCSEVDFPYHVSLDSNYDLYWIFNNASIEVKVVVKTSGYVAFGISGNGKMYPADVFVAWMKDGQPHIMDGYTTGHSPPTRDDHQDWHLVHGGEANGVTTFTVWRLLDTCDDQDRPIMEGTTRVIYSYQNSDSLSYHGPTQRGAKSILFLDPPTYESQNKPLPSSVTTIDFLNNNFAVPGRDTYYSCTTFVMPNLGGKRHMIKYEPVVQKGHETLVHHILIYYCHTKKDPSLVGIEFECNESRPPQLDDCDAVMVAWAIGGGAFQFPDIAGYSLGTDNDPGFFIMETHYDNPTSRSDYVDNSGMRMTLTSELRQEDVGLLEVGVLVNNQQVIPPMPEKFLSTGYCSEQCLAEAMGDQEIHVFATMLHSHLLGHAMRTRVVRGDQELPPLAQDPNYDFNFQEMRKLNNDRILKKGDRLITECLYTGRDRKEATYGGLSSRQEMCLTFVMYWPKLPLAMCRSMLLYPIENYDIVTYINTFDWSDPISHEKFQNITRDVPALTHCSGSKNFTGSLQYYPQTSLQPAIAYQEPSRACP